MEETKNEYVEEKNTKLNVPIWEKSNLTLKEAAVYSNIGINRLEMLISDPRCRFVLHVGNKRLIKRRLFDEYIEKVDMI